MLGYPLYFGIKFCLISYEKFLTCNICNKCLNNIIIIIHTGFNVDVSTQKLVVYQYVKHLKRILHYEHSLYNTLVLLYTFHLIYLIRTISKNKLNYIDRIQLHWINKLFQY